MDCRVGKEAEGQMDTFRILQATTATADNTQCKKWRCAVIVREVKHY